MTKEIIMKKSLAIFLVLFSIGGAALAQNDRVTGIEESTDPAKVADVERRAQEIISQQRSASGTTGAAGSSASSEPMHKKAHKSRAHKMKKGSKASAGTAQ
jgi:hypothetical protein